MKIVEMIKDAIVKLTVKHLADKLQQQGWERITAEQVKPQALTPEESAKPKAKPRRKNETTK